MAKFKLKPIFIEAEQWFKGKKIDGVIDEGPFKPSGNWYDRFDDHPDVYMRTPNGNLEVKEGYWIVTEQDGSRYPLSPESFKRMYEPVND